MNSRRDFLKDLGLAGAGLMLAPSLNAYGGTQKKWFDISLAQWSLHRTLQNGELINMDFPKFAKDTFGITAVEYVNSFFKDKATDKTYLRELLQRTKDNGIRNVLIMIDGEGKLGATEEKDRAQAVDNHYKWIDAAQFLGCHAVRVNAAGDGSPQEVAKQVVASLSVLADYGKARNISVIVENHGGLSSDGAWLSGVLRTVGKKNCGSLPDLGNFYEYDRYQGVKDLMPFAKGVSAKTYDFDAENNETKIDYNKMIKIIKDAGFRGYIGIEYEGKNLSEIEGVKATQRLLERFR